MRDPLAGQRQAINERRTSSLLWPDEGQKAPVKVGQTFTLRACSIEITKVHKIHHQGVPKIRAGFIRYDHKADKRYLLSRTNEYTEDPDLAVGMRDDIHAAATLDVVGEDARTPEHKNAGEPPEPEAVPPHEIPNYKGSIEARQRYLRDMAEERMGEQSQPLELRLLRLQQAARSRNVDISPDLRVIERRIAALEGKVLERAAA